MNRNLPVMQRLPRTKIERYLFADMSITALMFQDKAKKLRRALTLYNIQSSNREAVKRALLILKNVQTIFSREVYIENNLTLQDIFDDLEKSTHTKIRLRLLERLDQLEQQNSQNPPPYTFYGIDLIKNALTYCARKPLNEITNRKFLMQVQNMFKKAHGVILKEIISNADDLIDEFKIQAQTLKLRQQPPKQIFEANQMVALTMIVRCLIGHFHSPSNVDGQAANYLLPFAPTGQRDVSQLTSYKELADNIWNVMTHGDIKTDDSPTRKKVKEDLHSLWEQEKFRIVSTSDLRYFSGTNNRIKQSSLANTIELLPGNVSWQIWLDTVRNANVSDSEKGTLLFLMLGAFYVLNPQAQDRVKILRAFALLDKLEYTGEFSSKSEPYYPSVKTPNEYRMPYERF